MSMSLPVLSVDLQLEIFSYFPCKSVVRCMILSRLHRSLLTLPEFISKHHSHTSKKFLLLLASLDPSLHDDDHHLTLSKELSLPFLVEKDIKSIIGVSDGILCLETIDQVIFINPATFRYFYVLPEQQHNQHIYCHGFIRSGSSDHSLLRIEVDKQYHLRKERPPHRAWVYTFAQRHWRPVQTPVCTLCIANNFPRSGVVYHGSLHWRAKRWVDNRWYYFILIFNAENEAFEEILLPHTLAAPPTHDNNGVFVVGGSDNKPLTIYSVLWSRRHCTCAVWVMNEYGVMESWTQLFTFNLIGNYISSPLIRFDGDVRMKLTGLPFLLFHRNNGELLFYLDFNNETFLRSWNIGQGTFTVLTIDVDREFGDLYTGYYSPSLAFLGELAALEYSFGSHLHPEAAD